MRINFLKIVWAMVAIFALSACASYKVGKGARAIPGGYDRVAIPVFNNKTQEVGVETYFTDSLRREFERSHVAKVTSKADAQVIIEGIVSQVVYVPTIQITGQTVNQGTSAAISSPNPVDPTTLQPFPNPSSVQLSQLNPLPNTAVFNKQYAINIIVHIDVRRASDRNIVWSGDFTSQRQYQSPLLATPMLADGTPGVNTAAPLYNHRSHHDFIAQVAHDLMSEAHDHITENF